VQSTARAASRRRLGWVTPGKAWRWAPRRLRGRPSQLQGVVHTSHQSSSRRPPATVRKVRRTFASGTPKSLSPLLRRGSSPHRLRVLLRALRHHQVVGDTRSHVHQGRAGPAQLTGHGAQRAARARDLQPRWCVLLRRSALRVTQHTGKAASSVPNRSWLSHAHSCPHF
jgi:hypothetical protein